MKLWFVQFPTYRYTQDVKKIARAKGLKIIDAKFKNNYNPEKFDIASGAEIPKVTLKTEFQAKETE